MVGAGAIAGFQQRRCLMELFARAAPSCDGKFIFCAVSGIGDDLSDDISGPCCSNDSSLCVWYGLGLWLSLETKCLCLHIVVLMSALAHIHVYTYVTVWATNQTVGWACSLY